MRRMILILTGALLIVTAGCGGGGGVLPGITNLAQLAGIWDYAFNIQGVIDTGTEKFPVNYSVNGYYNISSTTVVDDDGDYWTWNYNGATLQLQRTYIDTGWDADLGNYYEQDTIKLQGTVSPGGTICNMSGTVIGTLDCDAVTDTIHLNHTASGNIAKR